MISVVIPCFNESEVLRLTHQAVVEAAADWQDSFELLLVDDGSTDDTWQVIQTLAARDPRVRGLRLSRNFGQQAALGAGMEQVRGEVVVVLDADLQDPPGLVAEMLARWREGYDVVYAQRNRRLGETWFKKATSHWFYRVQERLCTVPIPRDAGDFSLMDVRVARTLCGFREHALFWRGLRTWSGFRETAVMFDRPSRAAGATKYTVPKMIKLASHALLCFSELPLRVALYAGGLALGLSTLATIVSIGCWLFGGAAAEWTLAPSTLAMFFLGSTQLACLGILGEYVNRIYDEVRDRPRWIIAETAGPSEHAANPLPRRLAG